ncbi:MAG TPA: hypothetical protein VK891_03520, partial [Euzebyales bacterium]|nr:hypothetical protein [Euzebyales bacterium]
QAVAVLGLLGLAPTMVYVALGKLTPEEGAVRALVTFAVALMLGWVLSSSLRFYVRVAERAQMARDELAGRRAGDHGA